MLTTHEFKGKEIRELILARLRIDHRVPDGIEVGLKYRIPGNLTHSYVEDNDIFAFCEYNAVEG